MRDLGENGVVLRKALEEGPPRGKWGLAGGKGLERGKLARGKS